jgi:class 3 adenylate cyclase
MLLLTIARSARVDRFVRSRTVINMSNQVNWYGAFDKLRWLNPFFCRRKLRQKKQRTSRISVGMAGEESGSFAGTHGDDKGNALGPGVLQMGISAAVRAREEIEARETAPRWSMKRVLRSVGFPENEKSPAFHNEAATKIQRAWRAHSQSDTATNSSSNSAGTLSRSALSMGSGPKRGSFLKSTGRGSRFQLRSGMLRESQVGSDMREHTSQRVAIGILLSLVFTVLFSYTEPSTTTATAMISLHNQTQNAQFQQQVLESAKDTSIPDIFKYEAVSGGHFYFPLQDTDLNGTELKNRNQLRVIVIDASNQQSVGWFSFRDDRAQMALTSIVATIFIIIIWFVGMTAFAGPVMVLVVTPIERMVRLLGMLMLDPLGYQSTSRFKKFLKEEDTLIKGTRWTKDVLRGMETSFLMSTILRIGSLMKVGFGSAGVEIIRNNLQKGQNKNVLILSSQGSTVSCIFLFADIRQFTFATECLQEEVFVFTNRIAAVIHSICHAYGGAANKNIGDAFLLSWSLEDRESARTSRGHPHDGETELRAKYQQADKALLSVVKICMALQYDEFYLEPLSDTAKDRLKEKVLKKRSGPVVQMGFGLHAGKAVQGAIGSQRKIDATYVSEAVKRAEFLETETKTYGLKLLMSGTFHSLLTESTRRRCRKIDQVFVADDDEDGDSDDEGNVTEAELIHLHTFDMDVDAIYRAQQKQAKTVPTVDGMSDAGSSDPERNRNKRMERGARSSRQLRQRRRNSSIRPPLTMSEEILAAAEGGSVSSIPSADEKSKMPGAPELVLPKGPAFYSRSIWLSPEMKRMREKYVSGIFFQKYASGLQAFYNKDWEMAKQCFMTVLDEFDDGPSRYFMKQIKDNDGVPPRDFLPYRRD